MFSRLRRFELRDEHGNTASLTDLALDIASGEYPVVTSLLLRRQGPGFNLRKAPEELAWDAVTSLDWRHRRILVTDLKPASESNPPAIREHPVLLDRDVMDALILDVPRRQSLRANDLLLEEQDGRLSLCAADVSPWAVLRRLGRGTLGQGDRDRRLLLDWRDVEFLRGDPRAAREGRDYHRRVAALQPSEIAHLLDAVPYLHAAELLTIIPDPLAADTLEVMRRERQVQVFEELDDDQQVRLLQLMAPDNAADLLDGLGPERAEVLLEALPTPVGAALIDLLRYPTDSTGGIMTNDIVVVQVDLDVGEARHAIRDALARPDFVYYVYVVDDLDARRLQGVVTLRDLLARDEGESLRDVMQAAVVTLDPLMPAMEAARTVAEQHLAALPVVGRDGRLLGAVTADAALVKIAPPSIMGDTPKVFT